MSSSNVFCTICSERYRHTDNIHAGSCGHAFHMECLDRWREQSMTCPICRCDDAVFMQLYLNFEDSAEPGPARRGDASGESQRQGHSAIASSSSSSSVSSTSSSTRNINNNGTETPTIANNNGELRGIMREYENLLYENGIYKEELEYLNAQLGALNFQNSQPVVDVLNWSSDSD
ncbi:uncharacterized protein Dana_GF21985 [Drosophila ananassae]|uniref:RING-type domain-containing protein n=1 Tax=Drosophila ananassae TaxID=7217 RepID=B3MYQ8_DROAN|nr:E3 ubiquitin-protein ligase RNF133 [Drosophila ananassae]EDV32752.1 uncharacterized protein Dana_GF21985 [Drosophila ananassae]